MAFYGDEELLQNFLVEAEEILEQLGKLLVELEKEPDNQDLLNSAFRWFRTIKAGADFLEIYSLVAVCYRSEDMFNLLWQELIVIDSEILDNIFKDIDVINGILEIVRHGEMPESPDPTLLKTLGNLSSNDKPQIPVIVTKATPLESMEQRSGSNTVSAQVSATMPVISDPAILDDEHNTEDEFEELADPVVHRVRNAVDHSIEMTMFMK